MTRLLRRLLSALLIVPVLLTLTAHTPQAQTASDVPISALEDLGKLEARIQSVVKRVRPAVVGIRMASSSGSGTFISEDGWIATAGHVSGTRAGVKCRIITHGGEEFEGTVAGYYQSMDQGLVKADTRGKKVPFVQFGDSNKVATGQWVVAMGHPLGAEKRRDAVVRAGRVLLPKSPFSMIVMDAPVISGDSGGPVFDLNGRLVAINQSIQTNNVSINNVTPVATMVAALDRLKKGEQLGMDRPLGRGLGAPEGELTRAETQAYQRAMNQHTLEKYDEAWKLIEPLTKKTHCPPDLLYNAACVASLLSVSMKGKEQDDIQKTAVELLTRSVKAGWADVAHARADKDLDPLRKRTDYIVWEDLCAKAGFSPVVGLSVRASQGIRVSAVREGSPAESAGLQVNDVITHVGGRKISDALDWLNHVVRPGADDAEFAVMRGSRKLKLTLKVPAFGARVATYGGVQVKEVDENSTAYKAGFKTDDVIEKVGETRVSSLLDFANAMLSLDRATETPITVKRGPERMVIQFQFEGMEESPANAASGGWLRRSDQKQGENLLKLWDKLLAPRAEAVFVVKQKGRQAAFATAVDAAGWLLTKASELDAKEAITLLDGAGKEMSATLEARDDKYDLALLKVNVRLKTVVKFDNSRPVGSSTSTTPSSNDGLPEIGSLLATLDARGRAMTHGFTALPGYNSDLFGGPLAEDGVIGVTPDARPGTAVRVSALAKDGPAEKAGIKVGDVITGVEGKEIKDFDDLRAALSDRLAGEELKIEVSRSGKKHEFTVKLVTRRELYGAQGLPADPDKPGTGKVWLGISSASSVRPDGVRVDGVADGSPAALAGVKRGDILLAIDDAKVVRFADIARLLADKKPGDAITLNLRQDGKEVDLELELSEESGPLPPGPRNQPNVRGPVNDRADKFGMVIQHDGVVMPYQQGSPLVDLKGNVVGLNIARSDRTRTFALPASRVAEVLARLMKAAEPVPTNG